MIRVEKDVGVLVKDTMKYTLYCAAQRLFFCDVEASVGNMLLTTWKHFRELM